MAIEEREEKKSKPLLDSGDMCINNINNNKNKQVHNMGNRTQAIRGHEPMTIRITHSESIGIVVVL